MKKSEFDFVVCHIVDVIVSYLVEDTNMSLPDAFDKIYSTRIYADLQNRKNHLYRYSPAYLYERMQEEDTWN